MSLYRVIISNGSCQAPSMMVEAVNTTEAMQTAKKNSGLGKYKSWSFVPLEIKNSK